MEMFLMIAFASVPVLLVAVAMFANTAPKSDKEKTPEAAPGIRAAIAPPQFFADEAGHAGRVAAPPSRLPVEVLLSQIERHVRLEQAAAETFMDLPTRESLHSRTASPLMN